jgi:hypothetical protein
LRQPETTFVTEALNTRENSLSLGREGSRVRFHNHHQEEDLMSYNEVTGQKGGHRDHKIALWNAFVDSELTDITDDDCAIFPRLLPKSYMPVIERTARGITEFVLRLVSLPEREVRAIIPRGPIRDFLIEELRVLKYRPRRLTGSFRFDMAIVGEPNRLNPPKLLEINEIGFDGLARSSFFRETMFDLLPELKRRAFSPDAAKAEIRNMRRLGSSLARFQADCYNWDEEFLVRRAQEEGFDLRLVSPEPFRSRVTSDYPLMKKESVTFAKGKMRLGRDFHPASSQMSFALTLKDYQKNERFFANIVRNQTPHYGPFLMGLIASKMVLVLLSDEVLRRRILGTAASLKGAILEAFVLEGRREELLSDPSDYVLKHTDGFGGQLVFFDDEINSRLKKITPRAEHEWIVQARTRLNLISIEGLLSRRRKLITDLGVFVQYDWSRNQMLHFEVGGYMARATNRSWRVNVSGGGIQVPVMFLKR